MNRAGFSLVELIVVVLVATLLAAGIIRVVTAQHSTARFQNAVIQAQQANRTALDVLGAEIREVSASDGDLVAIAPESLSFRAYRTAGFVCDPAPNASQIDIWQLGAPFKPGDSIFVYVDNDTARMEDDTWALRTVTDTASTANPLCPSWSGLDLLGASTQYPVRRLSIGSGIAGLRRGAPVRVFTRLTYGIAEVDGQWVLARQEAGGERVALIGPLAPADENGLVFGYFRPSGSRIDPAAWNPGADTVARVGILVRSRSFVGAGQGGQSEFSDALVTTVTLRNN